MNNRIFSIVLFVLFTIVSNSTQAQFYVQLNTGYAAPLYYFGKNTVNEQDFINKYTYLDTTFTEARKYNMGNGLSFGSAIGYHTKKGLKFGVDVFYLNNKDIPFLYNKFTRDAMMSYNWDYGQNIPVYYSKDEQFLEYTSIKLSISPNIGYTFSLKNSLLEVNIGGTCSSIKIFISSFSRNEWISIITNDGLQYDPNGQFYNLIEDISKSRLEQTLLTPYLNFNYSYSIVSNISLNLAATIYPFASFNRDKGLFYYSSHREVCEDREIFTEQNWDEVTIVPLGTTTERYNLNCLNLNLGIRYNFDKN